PAEPLGEETTPVRCEPSPKKLPVVVIDEALTMLPEAPERLSAWLAASVTPALAVISPENVLALIVAGKRASLTVPAARFVALRLVRLRPSPKKLPLVVTEEPLTMLPDAPLIVSTTLLRLCA